MNDLNKITPSHLARNVFVYIRQSSPSQVENNRELTARQYALVDRARQLGWGQNQVIAIDEDLGLSGASLAGRSGFSRLITEVSLGHAGLVMGLEVSRLARNNADWYRLIELCGFTNTLIGDSDGLYHPALFNDRLLLGLKGTMSEAELHIIRARLEGGIRNKAARGELRRGLPVGFVWGEQDGGILFHPDESVRGSIRAVFDRFTEFGSARKVWLWFRSEGLKFPLQRHTEIRWEAPAYTAIHHILTNPIYAGAYVFGKTKQEQYIDENGDFRKRTRKLPVSEWAVLIREHHTGYIDWQTYESNQARLDNNTHPEPHTPGSGAVREGAALLQGLAVCGHCGRKLHTHYTGRTSSPGYHCAGKNVANGRGEYCLSIGAKTVDEQVVNAFLQAVTPVAVEVTIEALRQIESHQEAALSQWRLAVERARYEAERAERRYRAVEPENRLVARGLETEWENRLRELAAAEGDLRSREQQRIPVITPEQLNQLRMLGADLRNIWNAPTTTACDRKELLRTLLEEVTIKVNRAEYLAQLTVRWRGAEITQLDLSLPKKSYHGVRTDEDTIDLLRRLAVHYSDDIIAGIFNRQGRTTATGERFTAGHVGSLRRYRDIPRFRLTAQVVEGELVNVRKAAEILELAPSTLLRWLDEGFIAGEQITPGAPWQIRMTAELKARFVKDTPSGYVPMIEATKKLGVSRQTVLQRVKRGLLEAVHVGGGKRKGLRIKVVDDRPDLFKDIS